MNSSDPLGLTPEQRLEGELKTTVDEFLKRAKRNMETLNALPDGTRLRIIDQSGRVQIRSVEEFR